MQILVQAHCVQDIYDGNYKVTFNRPIIEQGGVIISFPLTDGTHLEPLGPVGTVFTQTLADQNADGLIRSIEFTGTHVLIIGVGPEVAVSFDDALKIATEAAFGEPVEVKWHSPSESQPGIYNLEED
jgi:hypothetical protein